MLVVMVKLKFNHLVIGKSIGSFLTQRPAERLLFKNWHNHSLHEGPKTRRMEIIHGSQKTVLLMVLSPILHASHDT
jgi:hypothetical protein